jgi:hypothetical protein
MIRDNIITSKERKFVFIVLSIIIVVLIVDTSIVKVYRFITPPLSTEWDIVTFTAITIVYTVVQYLLLRLVKTQARTSRLFALDLLHKVVFLIQCSLTALLIFVILQMIIISAYNTVIVLAAVTISYTLSIIMATYFSFLSMV